MADQRCPAHGRSRARDRGGSDLQATDRFKAADRSTVRGTIANFPSGPGSTGDIAFTDLRTFAPDYDLIALDPRGVGGSSPLTCTVDGLTPPPLNPPVSDAGYRELRTNQERFRKACEVTPAGVMPNMNADNVIRDLDHLRRALNLPEINVYGHSYGTLLAERYLAGFGTFVRASILDGVMDPTLNRREFVTTAAAATQALFDAFTRWCATDSTCEIHGEDPVDVLRSGPRNADNGKIPGTAYGRPWSAASVCVGWPGPARGSNAQVTSTGEHPTLLVANTGDVATPAAWARSVRRQLGGDGALLLIDSAGHGTGLSTPGCARDTILDYLETLSVPSSEAHCAP